MTQNAEIKDLRFHMLVGEIEDYAIILLDEVGNIENWNRGAEKIKGYKAEEIIGKNFRLFYTDEAREAGRPEMLLAKAAQEGKATDEEWRVRKDGTQFWGSILINAIHDENGAVIGFTKVTRDLTDRKRAEAVMRVEARNKELEQFAFVASHDLQEPLHTVNGFVDLLRLEYGNVLDESGLGYLHLISQAVDRMNSLIYDLLAYSRLGRNKEMVVIDCNKILEELKRDLAATIRQTGASIVADTLPVIKGYETEIRLLFQNLISNAIKFHKPGAVPEISITVKKQAAAWLFAVKDNGIGIQHQHFEKIFMLFQRLHKTEEYEGSGIGLTHCKKIVELHDGMIWVESTQDQGSTFYFTLAIQ